MFLTRSSTESEVKNEEAKPAPKATFSFAATMANLQKQKESPLVKVEDNRKVETSEEKKKRLRRESRRGLRVSFKADDDLVQTRTFVHDPEEEMGHEDSQVRDVMDSKGEGQTLKMHKDVDFMDEDEDYEPPEDFEPLSVWSPPQRKCGLFSQSMPSTDSEQLWILVLLRTWMFLSIVSIRSVAVLWSPTVQNAWRRSSVNETHSWWYMLRMQMCPLTHGIRQTLALISLCRSRRWESRFLIPLSR